MRSKILRTISERFPYSRECQGGTRRCFNMRLETHARREPVPSRALSSEATVKHSKSRFLETGKEKRLFGLDPPLETDAQCGDTHESVRREVSQRAKPKPAMSCLLVCHPHLTSIICFHSWMVTGLRLGT